MDYKSKSEMGKIWFAVDKVALLMVFMMFCLGVFVQSIISAKVYEVFFVKFVLFGTVGFMLLLVTMFSAKHWVIMGIVAGFVLSVILMILVFFVGFEKGGATRWLRIPFADASFQPIELYKVFSVAIFALVQGWMCETNISKHWRTLVATVFLLMTFLLVIFQPDHGQMILCLAALMFIAALSLEVRPWAAIGSVVIFVVVGLYALREYSSHGAQRINAFLSNDEEKYSQLWYVKQTQLDPLLFGQSPGALFWPKTPDIESDFVMAMLIEQFGLVVAFALPLLFMALMLRLLMLLWFSDNIRWWFMASGFVVLYLGQTLINVGTGTLNLPAKGVTLPMISYGGSAQIGVFIMLGILLMISRKDMRGVL